MTNHGVWYPQDYLDLPVRQNLLLSQTNITEDPIEGLRHAAAAYDVALQPEISSSDPTAAGEAAAKAAFRSVQAELPLVTTDEWFERSYSALPDDDPQSRRERIATYLLEGRAIALNLGRYVTIDYTNYTNLISRGRLAFENAEKRIEDQRDPYATMLYGHSATFEAMDGDSKLSGRIALKGIKAAVKAAEEKANTPDEQLTATERIKKSGKFMLKHAGRNIIAGVLAVTRPLERLEKPQRVRRGVSLKMLG